jgi:hypothetical protein
MSQSVYNSGEVSGKVALTKNVIERLRELSAENIVESFITVAGKSHDISVLPQDETTSAQIILYTGRLFGALYFEDINELILNDPVKLPTQPFFIHNGGFYSDDSNQPIKFIQLKQLISFIELLKEIAAVATEEMGEPLRLIFFQKRQLSMPIIYNENVLKDIPFLHDLTSHLTVSHDKHERREIFINELVSQLAEVEESNRFASLLLNLSAVYENYQKSHLLYLEKFSYHDLKSEVDSDIFDYTKKIYGAVNDIQPKIIAVPAAFLLVLSQFNFAQKDPKNNFILMGCILFAVLLEVLLTNQFDLLDYIKKEINHLKNELKNKDTSLDLSEFTKSFSDLTPVMDKQKCYLWIFRAITWSVPLTALSMLIWMNNK